MVEQLNLPEFPDYPYTEKFKGEADMDIIEAIDWYLYQANFSDDETALDLMESALVEVKQVDLNSTDPDRWFLRMFTKMKIADIGVIYADVAQNQGNLRRAYGCLSIAHRNYSYVFECAKSYHIKMYDHPDYHENIIDVLNYSTNCMSESMIAIKDLRMKLQIGEN